MAVLSDLRFVALGDSATVGIGDAVAGEGWRGWAQILAHELSVHHRLAYQNLAAAGATTASVRRTQLVEAVRLRPHLASVIVGVNDTMRSTWDIGRVRDDIVTCVGSLSESRALVLTARFHNHGEVFGLPEVLRRPLWRRIEAVNEAYDTAHAAFGGLRIDLTAEPLVYQRRFWSVDRLHPAELGHRRIAYEFAAGLQALGYAVDRPDLTQSGGELPSTWRDLVWMVTAGAPWLGRRARDLGPWAVRLAAGEAVTRLRARTRAA